MKRVIALILSILLCLSLAAGCGSRTAKIDLTDYMNALFRGRDGEGTARGDFDFSGFENSVAAQFHGSEDAILQKLVRFESALEITVTPDKGLKNGDQVTLTAVYDQDAAKAAGIAIGSVSKTVTVEGLTSAAPAPSPTDGGAASSGDLTPEAAEGSNELDPFDPAYWNTAEGIEIRYTGASPYGWLEAVNHLPAGNPLSRVYYRFSEEKKVYEGDKVTVTAYLTGDSAEQYTLKNAESEYVVGPVSHYLTEVSELDRAAASALKSEAERLTQAFAAGTLEFRDKAGWSGFYNGETVTVDSCAARDTVYAVRYRDGFIRALLLPCSLHVTVAEPDWKEDPQTYEYDLLVLCAVDGLVVDEKGAVDYNRPERTDQGVPEVEEEMVKDRLTWYENSTLETAQLPG